MFLGQPHTYAKIHTHTHNLSENVSQILGQTIVRERHSININKTFISQQVDSPSHDGVCWASSFVDANYIRSYEVLIEFPRPLIPGNLISWGWQTWLWLR